MPPSPRRCSRGLRARSDVVLPHSAGCILHSALFVTLALPVVAALLLAAGCSAGSIDLAGREVIHHRYTEERHTVKELQERLRKEARSSRRLTVEVMRQRQENRRLERDLDLARKEVALASGALARRRAQISVSTHQRTAAEAQAARLTAHNRSVVGRIATLEATLRKGLVEARRKAAALTTLAGRLRALEQEEKLLNAKVLDGHTRLTKMKKWLKDLGAEQQKLVWELRGLRAKNTELEARVRKEKRKSEPRKSPAGKK